MRLRTLPITEPGIYTMTAEEYHADPCPGISLSHSLARKLVDRSPYHAMKHHPKMGGLPNAPSRIMAIGSAAHALTLGKGNRLVRIPFENYKKKDAQTARDEAIAAGLTPILDCDYEEAADMAPFAREAIEATLGHKLDVCLVECVVVAQDPVSKQWRRIMVDVMTPDLKRLLDYKTTDDVQPETFARRLLSNGADTQDVFYQDVVGLIDPDGAKLRQFSFLAQERDYPEVITIHQIDNAAREIAENRMTRAKAKWDACLAANDWPSYGRAINHIAPRPWDMEREMQESYREQLEQEEGGHG